MTVAMYLAKKEIIPPKEWYHDPNIKNEQNKSVCNYLCENNLFIENKWYSDDYK